MDTDNPVCQPCNNHTCSCAGVSPTDDGCTSSVEPKAEVGALQPAWRLQWWLEHSQKQTAKLWEMLGDHLDEATQSAMLEQLGRNCAMNFGKAQQYVGNPEGFFQFMHEHSGETIRYDREAGTITVITAERDCDCRLVNSRHIAPIYCNCSLGWQKQTYETILGRKVDVKIVESVIRGSKRCVFHITLLDEMTDDLKAEG
ncbi:MAG: hypothetical protein LLF96_04940 [Eubacteriales bacterium]|nr:hypothetical protein [Eubacteriales bacterium]